MGRVRTPEARAQEWQRRKKRDPERVREVQLRADLKFDFDMSLEEFRDLEARQNGLCAICDGFPTAGKTRLSVDHCHATDLIRGLLCYHCNLGLGWFSDDEAVIARAISYLQGEPLAYPNEDGGCELPTGRPRTHKKYHLKTTYGLAWDAYLALREAQSGHCAICLSPETSLPEPRPWLCVDHCHDTNRVRGLLCTGCNAALGYFQESEMVLRAAINYLESARALG